MLLYTKLAPPKVPKRRSRAGCTYCKEKKKKCNEERPQCNRCAERGVACSYEPVRPRQRRKRDSTSTATGSPNRRNGSTKSSYLSGREHSEGSSDDSDANTNDVHYQEWPRTPASANGPKFPRRPLWDDLQVGWRNGSLAGDSPLDVPSPFSFDTASIFSASGDGTVDMNCLSPISALPFDFPPSLDDGLEGGTGEPTRRASMASLPIARERTSALVPYGGPFQTHTAGQRSRSTSQATRSISSDLAMIAPSPTVSPILEFRAPAFAEFSTRPNRRALVDHFCNVLSHLIVFREESGNPFQQLVLPLTARSGTVTEAMYALASAHLEYRGVENDERSDYFHNRAIQGLARLIRKEGKGVDRNELLAAIMLLVYYEVLVQKGRSNIVEGHLRGALAIMCSNPEPLDPTATFLERAFSFYDVIAALSNGTPPLSAAPAAGCLVPVSPLGAPATSPLSSVDTLLGMATTLWPIMHRLSTLPSLKGELEAAVVAAGTDGCSSTKVTVLRTEFEMSASSTEAALKTWQPYVPASIFVTSSVSHEDGDAVDLVPSQEDKDLVTAMRRVVELETGDIDPALNPDSIADEDTNTRAAAGEAAGMSATQNRLQSILHNALAYKHSALVYLYRTIHELDRAHEAVQRHTRAALRHCAATVAAKGPMGALLWPLFVAACEAVAGEDRALARQTFLGVERRQGMMNIERAWEIVQEVWRRADEVDGAVAEVEEGAAGPGREEGAVIPLEELFGAGRKDPTLLSRSRTRQRKGRGADLWRRVSEDMGVHIVFG